MLAARRPPPIDIIIKQDAERRHDQASVRCLIYRIALGFLFSFFFWPVRDAAAEAINVFSFSVWWWVASSFSTKGAGVACGLCLFIISLQENKTVGCLDVGGGAPCILVLIATSSPCEWV